jgi:hypothetical protein
MWQLQKKAPPPPAAAGGMAITRDGMSGNPNYPYSYPLKTLIWISVFRIRF